MVDKIDVSESIIAVGKAIKKSEHSYYEKHKKNQRIDIKRNEQLYFFETGKISFYRAQDDVLTITMSAPCIAGVAQMLFQYQTHYIRCSVESTMWVMDIKDAIILLSKNNLWIHTYNILAKQMELYFEREYLILQKNSRDIIMRNIEHIWNMCRNDRESISLYTFILERNHISRSNIHKIIAELENEGIIKTLKGKLVDFSFNKQ